MAFNGRHGIESKINDKPLRFEFRGNRIASGILRIIQPTRFSTITLSDGDE